ncbi:putative membrane protein [Neobacillus niacini]|uniref:DUF2085 domain-containing protein n=1 Tax=Neobacillus niacini TaxID=86668 RepID=UPI00277EEABB|nr:DUF2085 domain-containing protein [Neobacillus niacini]MDQ1004785.1 putative membrane protein [Neobacillus niacini]
MIVLQTVRLLIVDRTVTVNQIVMGDRIVIVDQIVINLKWMTDIVPCHRMKSRSLTIKGYTLPICARCTGILLGYLFFPLLFFLNLYFPLWLGIILNVPMVLDGWTQKKKVRMSNNTLRLSTGIVSGFGQSIIIVSLSQIILSILL